jgi:hypothetical protein
MYSSYSFMTSALDAGEWSASRPRDRTPPRTHCTGGWVGPRAGLDTEARGKILCLCWVSNLDRLVVQSVARHYTDWATWLLSVTSTIYFLQKTFMTIFYLYCNNELSTTTVRKPDQRQQPVRYVANKSIAWKQFEAHPSIQWLYSPSRALASSFEVS